MRQSVRGGFEAQGTSEAEQGERREGTIGCGSKRQTGPKKIGCFRPR